LIHLALVASVWASPLAVDVSVHQLPNGLTVVLSENHRTDTIALHLRYGVGSKDERPGERGSAHLFEHLMFEGSRNAPGNAFDEWLTAAGGDDNAFTSEDETAYTMTFPSGALDLALFLESDRMGFLGDGLTEQNLANQKAVVLAERARRYDQPNGRDSDALVVLQFPEGHPYHHPVIGTVADVQGLDLDGVRDFWGRHYRPRNAVLGMVGHFDTEEALARIEHWFSDVPDRGPAEVLPPAGEAWRVASERGVASDGLLVDEVEERTLYLSWPTVPIGHPDEQALELLSWVLSAGRGTRLDDRLYYGSDLASDCNAWSFPGVVDGHFVVYASTSSVRLERLARVIGRVLASVGSRPPSAEELDRARGALRGSRLDRLEEPEDLVEMLVDCQFLHGDAACLEDRWARYEAVTTEDLVRVARTWLRPERRVSLSVVSEGDRGGMSGAVPVELP